MLRAEGSGRTLPPNFARVEGQPHVTLPKLGAAQVYVNHRATRERLQRAATPSHRCGLAEMSITLLMHRRLGFHLLRFQDLVTFAELAELGRMHSAIPAFAAADTIHIIEPDADMSRLQLSELAMLRAHYAQLQRSLDLYLVRRAGWVCSTAATCRLVEYWLDGRHSRDGQKTEVVMAADVADLCPLFSQDEIEAVQLSREFTHVTRIGGPLTSGRVAW